MKPFEREPISHYISHLNRLGINFLSKEYTPFDIGYGQYQFLVQLYNNDGLSHEQLTLLLGVDKSTTTRAITKLYHAGYVDVQQKSEDKRKYKIFLTEKAKALKNDILEIAGQWENQLTDCLSEDEKNILYLLLKKIALSNTPTNNKPEKI